MKTAAFALCALFAFACGDDSAPFDASRPDASGQDSSIDGGPGSDSANAPPFDGGPGIDSGSDAGSDAGPPPAMDAGPGAPTLTLNGERVVNLLVDDAYSEDGATCTDGEDGDIAVDAPVFAPALDTGSAGTYVATYICTDSDGLSAEARRTVNVNVAGGMFSFANVTAAVIDRSPGTTAGFWTGMPDVNGDGCLDLFIGTHTDNFGSGDSTGGNSSMFIQDNEGGDCAGTFTYYDRRQQNPSAADCESSYNQDQNCTPGTQRITGRYMFGNWTNHPEGLWSFYGHDFDGAEPAIYRIADSARAGGGPPLYQREVRGCPGGRVRCSPADFNGDGRLEYATSSHSSAPGVHVMRVFDMLNRDTMIHDSQIPGAGGGPPLTIDIDGDTYPDALVGPVTAPEYAGKMVYFRNNPETDDFSIVDDAIPTPWWRTTGECQSRGLPTNHQNAIDYDSDGDLDLLIGSGAWGPGDSSACDRRFFYGLYRNDGGGRFTDVSESTGIAAAELRNQLYYSTYLGTQIIDVNNDGFPDVVYGGWGGSRDTVAILINNGGTSFTVHRVEGFPANSGLRPWINAGDYDNDGKIDLVGIADVGDLNDVVVFRNTTANENHYMGLRVRGLGANTDGLHTQVTWYEAGTTNVITTRYVLLHPAHSELVLHAGLGNRTSVDVHVQYPNDGPLHVYESVAVDAQYVTFREGGFAVYNPGTPVPMRSGD